ncbi:Putative glycosylphosphatidylinositol-mannosyltransferase I, PIG-X/PBN1 [Colletotrichum destructivum]|uniref:Protein PBN1 n=1 Tax=Colletotrichum destructivum TaxID=34406 RepID=A0AAX4HWM2_9PEZI|nr:Putative glycosylphosphatidylinositol-mannosyltransferase I, PIG-X/PBN1 [Colletotrichum destructivum]
MRQRITFIHKPSDGVPPESLDISNAGVEGPEVLSVREDRLTLALEELPSELSQLLGESHELHIRWVSPLAYDTIGPLTSRVSPGFHLFYTPKREGEWDGVRLCEALRNTFGGSGCLSSESFTSLPNDRFSHSAALQYYQPLEDLTTFTQYAAERLCPASDTACKSRADELKTAASLDISYDTISHALKVTAQWPYDKYRVSVASMPNHRTEVGILTTDFSSKPEPHEIGMAGGLTVLGEHKKPSPVHFNVPARHRLHGDAPSRPSSFSAKFLEPTGLHPTLQLALTSAKPPVDDAYCAVHAHLTLPKAVFADRYQLADDLFLKSKNLTALRYSTSPVDLEAPAYATKPWGSGVLLELKPPAADKDGEWTAEVPLHLRYLEPAAGGYTDVEVPYPAVFWACSSEEGTKFPSSPFERVNLGYDALFGPRTVFWHVDPRPIEGGGGGRLMSTVRAPVLEAGQADWVRVGTAAAVVVGFTWVLWRLIATYSKSGYGKSGGTDEKKKQ